jgi:hypothetical protein
LSRPAPAARPHSDRPASRWSSLPWTAIGITLLVLLTAAFSVEPIRDAVTLGVVDEARLALPASYLALEPISSVLDTLTLLTVAQHVALLLWVFAIFALWRVLRARGRRAASATTTTLGAARREVRAALLLLAGIFVVYAVGTMAPRPMAALSVSDPMVLIADFHSHTKYSHDGRIGWDEDDVRSWYAGAGFNVGYITDHQTFEGAERGVAANPGLAGEGTMLLQGLEAFYKGEHVNILSADRRYRGLTNATLHDVDEEALRLASLLPATTPVLIETMPGKLANVPAASDTAPGVRAIELIDGSPRGLAQVRRERARIIHIADSLDLALVTGSDNHGWGRAAPGWTLLRVIGWRGMRSDSLATRLESTLRNAGRGATRVVERRIGCGTNVLCVAFTPAVVGWRMFTTLSSDERVSWLIWTWGVVIVAAGFRRLRLRPSTAA